MYTGTMIEDLMKNVERAEARAREVQKPAAPVEVRVPYAYQFHYADRLVEVA